MLCLFVIGNFVWSGLRKKIGDLGFFFCCGLLVLVMGLVVAVADGRGGCGWCCGCCNMCASKIDKITFGGAKKLNF